MWIRFKVSPPWLDLAVAGRRVRDGSHALPGVVYGFLTRFPSFDARTLPVFRPADAFPVSPEPLVGVPRTAYG